ncbi:putative K(+)-stimulated pyrophosphate-energized sodium pump HppA [Thermoclostridium stercorarium subsp. stercorarium DSM 8532]|jgi:K(+)-stimulated pyrophosphate-energized sodium pump|uniref:K(+)-insensitive pyrophosphate-energized proton pump n=3 Tax=Thermoclostridium stercorarium TaxID=1510 RepID=L7VMM6_THES1|nr:sodium-translocating pyrophosphatase [Thermoclostridium stercorarium]AGC68002.1 putative K(+)-stimulated pyrophosphate-energized sodium pump HppA [Thermoclostridium stercorarium subsp. stercorarium DSM 8532]AGI39037.1 pyrophosphatase [Thermoclostridium stercorarium subsp. stercorarium DSM 8532]ANW98403.1 sodium-translocating pyrophosphatase [Thermoclostridium stercorarium subsp. thermolacticum DSM 2910]ANX00939.1 sodium-translocating pyrophosphatase [Thermoclostridium stercorarium subsp. lep
MNQTTFELFSVVIAVAAFAFAAWLYQWVKKQPSSNKKIAEVGGLIRSGAATFLKKEYTVLARFACVVAILILLFLPHPIWQGNAAENITMAVAYLAGTALSALAGKIGIEVATIANVKSAEAAKKGIKPAFLTGFRGGAVMGMAVVGASLLGVSLVMLITGNASAVLGFSFGASSLALFAKAGGGIFTKTADISADLVGKVELGIPEDDPRNPAVIADNVGDNVGDVAGMGADLFDSHVASLAAALVMAASLGGSNVNMVLCYAALGLLASIIGVAMARMGKNGDPSGALNNSTYTTTFVYIILTAIATAVFNFVWRIWFACIVGLLVGVIIGIATDYFTNDTKNPVRFVAKASKSGPAFTILSGMSYGMLSIFPAMVGIAVASLLAYKISEPLGPGYAMFGISMSAVGMLSIVGMIISNDAYGPIVDNARGLAEMGELGDDVLSITDDLDSAGNTVKAITKGFSIAAAGLTVIALLGAFMSEVNSAAAELGKTGIEGFDIINPLVFFGLIIGAAIPAIFSAMLMLGVDRNAQRMVAEIHRQFNEIEGLKEGKPGVKPEYDKCIEIATTGAIRELIPAGLMAILATIAVGIIGGVKAIGGFLGGNIISGLIFALFMSNSGGLWDNAKKYVEAGNEGGKGSDAHKAAVVGDTVGDPFKDTAGPSINTQITVVSLVASLMSALFLTISIF